VGRWIQVQDAGFGGPDDGALKQRGHESVRPVADAIHGVAAGIGEDDVGRETLVFGAEAIGEPGSQCRPPGLCLARVHVPDRRFVTVDVGVHRSDDGDVVDDRGEVGQEFRDIGSACTVLAELPRTSHELLAGTIDEAEGDLAGIVLPAAAGQLRLRVEKVNMARATMHEEGDHGPGPGDERGSLRLHVKAQGVAGNIGRGRQEALLFEHPRERDTAHTHRVLGEELATRERAGRGRRSVRGTFHGTMDRAWPSRGALGKGRSTL